MSIIATVEDEPHPAIKQKFMVACYGYVLSRHHSRGAAEYAAFSYNLKNFELLKKHLEIN